MNNIAYMGMQRLFAEPENKLRDKGREHIWRQRLKWVGLILGIWTLDGLLASSQLYFMALRTKHPVPFLKAVVWQMGPAYLFAAVTPLVLWLSRRFRIERRSWRRSVAVHTVAGILIAMALIIIDIMIDVSFYVEVSHLTPLDILLNIFAKIDYMLIVYWLIVLISHAYAYYQNYRESQLAASQLAAQLAEAQLKALKMQLHPHFLFNTLHSISSLLSKDTEAARKMIAQLGDFLRLTLENSGAQEVLLQQELEFLKCYLEIERIRFCDRLSIDIDADPQALRCQVPNLILQPIVENAIRHGIAPRSAAGRIEVSARRSNGMLRLQVKDNGPGLTMDLLLNKGSNQGIGMANTRERLDQLFGNKHRFELSNDPEGGLIVTIEMPAVLEKDSAPDPPSAAQILSSASDSSCAAYP